MSSDVRQITTDFELETRIRKISQEVLQILLKNHNNVFEFVSDNRALMQNFDERIRNNETLCGLIDGKIQTRLNRIDVLAREVHEIKDFCYLGLKTVNSDVSQFQRQMDEVHTTMRAQRPLIEKTNTDVERLDISVTNLKQTIATLQETTHERIQKEAEANSSRVERVRVEFDKMLHEIVQAREAVVAKQDWLTELTKDFELFRASRTEIYEKINQLFQEVECRALAADLLAHRKLYDDKMMGYFENVNRSIGKLDLDVKRRIKANEEKTELIFKDQQEIANRLRMDLQNSLKQRKQETEDLLRWINQRFSEVSDRAKEQHQKLEHELQEKQQSINTLQQLINRNHNEHTRQLTTLQDDKVKMQKQIHSHFEMIRNLERIDDDIKLQVARLSDRLDTVSKNSGMGEGRFQEFQAQFVLLKQMIGVQSTRSDDLNHTITRMTAGISQLNDRINKTNESSQLLSQQISAASSKQAERLQETRRYLDQALANYAQRFSEIRSQLKVLDQLKADMNNFTIRFAEQIAANEVFSRSVTEKLETTVAQLTKSRSDMTIRLETSNKEIVRVGGEIKAVEKMLASLVLFESLLVEAVTLVGACQLSFQFEASSDKIKQQTNQKYSSIFDGFILELDAKSTQDSFKYRGEIGRRVGFLSNMLQHLLKEIDTIRKSEGLGKTYQGGKAIFQLMQPSKKYSSEEGRRQSLSMRTVNKRGDSFVEFPKLNKKEG